MVFVTDIPPHVHGYKDPIEMTNTAKIRDKSTQKHEILVLIGPFRASVSTFAVRSCVTSVSCRSARKFYASGGVKGAKLTSSTGFFFAVVRCTGNFLYFPSPHFSFFPNFLHFCCFFQ